jgi:glycosyl transferase, family 25
MIKIFVINLKHSKDRWAHMERQFEQLGLDVVRFEAVDGRAGQHALFCHYDDQKSRRWKGRSLSFGQLGCYASHFLIWHECVNLNAPVMIIEDDAIIEPSLIHAFLARVDGLPAHFECIRLFKNHSKHHKVIPVQDFDNFSIVKYTKGPMRATGYYVTPSGAEKFIRSAGRWFLPVDITMDRFWVNGVECYGMVPPCISNDISFASTITTSEKKLVKRDWILRIRRELFSAQESMHKWLHNIRFKRTCRTGKISHD